MHPDDIDAIMGIEVESFAAPWSRQFFYDALLSPITQGYVVETDGAIIGYIIFYTVTPEAHILNFAVDPRRRRSGCGTRLIDYVLKKSSGEGVNEFFLEVREGNRGAIGLYRKCGFASIGKRKKYYRETNEDAIVMYLSV